MPRQPKIPTPYVPLDPDDKGPDQKALQSLNNAYGKPNKDNKGPRFPHVDLPSQD